METNRIIVRPLFYFFFLSSLFIIPNGYALTNFKGVYSIRDQWVFHSEVSGVKIYYQISSCENQSVVYLKFDNTNKRPVRIAWKEIFTTKQISEEQEGYLGQKQLTLSPGITSQSDCSPIKVKECVTLAQQALPTYKADILKFNLKDISVTNLS